VSYLDGEVGETLPAKSFGKRPDDANAVWARTQIPWAGSLRLHDLIGQLSASLAVRVAEEL